MLSFTKFTVGCSSDDSMGKGKPQLYCSGAYHICWCDLNLNLCYKCTSITDQLYVIKVRELQEKKPPSLINRSKSVISTLLVLLYLFF